MKNIAAAFFLIFVFALSAEAQHSKKNISIAIKDNVNMQFISNDYYITNDSLIIRGDSDYGRTKVRYIGRALSKKEKKGIKNFLKTFPADSLEDAYFSDYSNMSYISPEHYPRVVTLEMEYNGKEYKSKMTNCYATKIADLCIFLNDLFPPEVRIKLKKEEFNAFFP